MSLETWKAEFYPIPAEYVSTDDALHHNLALWLVFVKKILINMMSYTIHMQYMTAHILITHFQWTAAHVLYVNSIQIHVRHALSMMSNLKHLGISNCGCHNAYRIFLKEDSPEPMINLLQTAIDMQQAPQTVL